MSVRIYTDGASSYNGFGGYAAIMFVDGTPIDGVYGGAKEVTNNRMELAALIAGMKLVPTIVMARCSNCGVVPVQHFDWQHNGPHQSCTVLGEIKRPVYEDPVVISDSEYCVKGATHWVHAWKQNGWKTAAKQPVKNQDLWEEVDWLARRTTAVFEWCKGHSGVAGNELADQWAGVGKAQMYGAVEQAFEMKIPTIGK